MPGLSFSKASLNSAINFSPTSDDFHCDQRTVAASAKVGRRIEDARHIVDNFKNEFLDFFVIFLTPYNYC